jgi:hypothetical protein
LGRVIMLLTTLCCLDFKNRAHAVLLCDIEAH